MDTTVMQPPVEAIGIIPIALLDEHGTITWWSSGSEELTGFPEAEVLGRPLIELIQVAPDEMARMLDDAQRSRVLIECWAQRRDGSSFWCNATLAPLQGQTGFVFAAADATHRREALDLFEAALRHAPVYVFNVDTELRSTWVPRVPPELAAHIPEDLIGRTAEEMVGEEAAAPIDALSRAVLESGIGRREEVAVDTPAGTYYYDLSIEALRDGEGNITGLTCAAFDVTARRQAEEALRRSRAQLAEAEELARMGSWEWDVVNDVITWSDGLYKIYGIEREEFDSRYAARQRDQRVHPEDQERVERRIASTLKTGNPFEMEYRIVRPDGRLRIVHSKCEAVVNDRGEVVKLFGTAQDVTELRRAEDALEQTAVDLARRASELQQLASTGTTDSIESLLGERQLQILALIAEGLSNLEIADRLFISEATVKWHVRQILRKLDVANRAQAVARYLATR